MLGFLKWVENLVDFVSTTKKRAEDFVDRLNYRVTVSVLLLCAIGIFMKDYGGEPLKCWGRGEWRSSWQEYAHDYCFIESTYFIPMADPRIPNNKDTRRKAQLDYYQWVPFVLVLQAVSYLLPELFWTTFSYFSGFHVGTLLEKAHKNTVTKNSKDKKGTRDLEEITHMAKQIHLALKAKHNANTINPFNGPSNCRGSLTLIYFITKLLLIGNSVIQFLFLGYFLGKNNKTFGWDAVDALTNGDSWRDSGLFPRVTLCDFKVRGIRNKIENYTVQCVLMGNLINEKIFISLWWWMLILAIISVINLGQWIWTVNPYQHEKFVFKSLQPSVHLIYPLPKPRVEDEERKKEEKEEREKLEKEEKEKLEKALGNDNTADNAEQSGDGLSMNQSEQGSTGQSYSVATITTLARTDANQPTSPPQCCPCSGMTETERKAKPEKEEKQKKKKKLHDEHNKFEDRLSDGTMKKEFAKYLGIDGILILELINCNSNEIVTSAVIGKVYELYVDSIATVNRRKPNNVE